MDKETFIKKYDIKEGFIIHNNTNCYLVAISNDGLHYLFKNTKNKTYYVIRIIYSFMKKDFSYNEIKEVFKDYIIKNCLDCDYKLTDLKDIPTAKQSYNSKVELFLELIKA